MSYLDPYSIRARRTPVVIVAMPAVILLATSVLSASTFGVASGLVVVTLSFLSAQLGRDRGRNLQDSLWESWGGGPTSQALRFRGQYSRTRVAQCHSQIEQALAISLPSEADEAADPSGADERYEAAVIQLIALTRDRTAFPLVFEENANYGFRRNCLGLRPFGIALSFVVVLVSFVLLLAGTGSIGGRAAQFGWPLAAGVGIGLFWLLVVKPAWVRVPADAYARRLIEASFSLPRASQVDSS